MIDQLVRIYLEEEKWHKTKLSKTEAEKYYASLLKRGKLAYHTDKEGMVIGYIEWYNISFSQFQRLIAGKPFHIDDEDIDSGNICYVTDVWIKEEYRDSEVGGILKRKIFKANRHCIYFAGRETKRNRRVRIHGRREKHDSTRYNAETGSNSN